MRVIVTKDYEEMSLIAADEIRITINDNKAAVLGLATGQTPVGTYSKLMELYKRGRVDFQNVTTFNLDEYYGLSESHPQSYKYFMNSKLFNHVNVNIENVHIPNGTAEDIEKECSEYDKAIKKAGGIDLQLLGIGVNGHIGFNEPSDFLQTETHLTELTEATKISNSKYFTADEKMPDKAITMGLGSIMQAKKILLLASGKEKAPIISRLVQGKIDTKMPASILQVHPDVLLIVDEDAASLIE